MCQFNDNDESLMENLRKQPSKSLIKTSFKGPQSIIHNMMYVTRTGKKTLVIDGLGLETWIKMITNHLGGYDSAMQYTLSKEKYLGFNLEGHIAANLRMMQELFRDKLDILWGYLLYSPMKDQYLRPILQSALNFMHQYGSWSYSKEIKLDDPISVYYDEKGVITESSKFSATESTKISFAISAATMFCIAAVMSRRIHIKGLRLASDILYEHYHSASMEISHKYDNY